MHKLLADQDDHTSAANRDLILLSESRFLTGWMAVLWGGSAGVDRTVPLTAGRRGWQLEGERLPVGIHRDIYVVVDKRPPLACLPVTA